MELIKDIQESFILDKLKNIDYAKDLYLALCNNEWKKKDLTNTFSFREAARIIAELRNQGEVYLDFYPALPDENYNRIEGDITVEIRTDLKKIDWFL